MLVGSWAPQIRGAAEGKTKQQLEVPASITSQHDDIAAGTAAGVEAANEVAATRTNQPGKNPIASSM